MRAIWKGAVSFGLVSIVTDDDLASLPVASSKSIEVQEFVPLESIDPIYFDRSYYLSTSTGATTSSRRGMRLSPT